MTDDKYYLDPETNPLIPAYDEAPDLPAAGDPGADGLAPMMDFSLNPEALAEKISQAFPGQDEVEIGKTVLVKMATGNFTVKESGQPITDLPLAVLMQLADLLKDKQKS